MPDQVLSSSEEETEAFGATLAAGLGPGDIVLVTGDLGSGKTTMVRGACRALGFRDPVTSPTYTIGHLYETDGARIAHLDLYRLDSPEGEDPGLLEDYFTPDAIVFVEWPPDASGLDSLPVADGARVLRVTIEALPDRTRKLVAE